MYCHKTDGCYLILEKKQHLPGHLQFCSLSDLKKQLQDLFYYHHFFPGVYGFLLSDSERKPDCVTRIILLDMCKDNSIDFF